jgi:hypothetical protein
MIATYIMVRKKYQSKILLSQQQRHENSNDIAHVGVSPLPQLHEGESMKDAIAIQSKQVSTFLRCTMVFQ